MSFSDKTRTPTAVHCTGLATVHLWSDGVEAELDLTDALQDPAFAAVRLLSKVARWRPLASRL
jgi:hypothetical protein